MKAFVVVAFALFAACLAEDPTLIVAGDVTHVVIPKDTRYVAYKWNGRETGYMYAEGCYGVVKVIKKTYNDFDPAIDKKNTSIFDDSSPANKIAISGGHHIFFYVDEVKNAGPDGINGAVDFVFGATQAERDAQLPDTKDELIRPKISLNSKKATLTWNSTGGVDKSTIYRKDIMKTSYDASKDFPPEGYHMTACSAKMWLTIDQTATDGVSYQHQTKVHWGVATVKDITDKKVTIVAVLTEKKNVTEPYPRAYDFIALGDAASTTIVSTLALLLLVVSVLLF